MRIQCYSNMETILPSIRPLTFGPKDTPGPERLDDRTSFFPSITLNEDGGPHDEIWRSYLGGRRNMDKLMIPGFTGFVPRSRSYFARTYAEICREAIREFDQELKARPPSPRLLYDTYTNSKVKRQTVNIPLEAVSRESYQSPRSWPSLGSPYTMDEQNPHKYFISGFTGYVPKAQYMFGTGYPITTNKAIIKFGRQVRGPLSSAEAQFTNSVLPPLQAVYTSHLGMIPAYTGHVPGCRFSFGQTFGKITHDAVVAARANKRLTGRCW